MGFAGFRLFQAQRFSLFRWSPLLGTANAREHVGVRTRAIVALQILSSRDDHLR